MDDPFFIKQKADQDDSARIPFKIEEEDEDNTFKLLKSSNPFENDDKE